MTNCKINDESIEYTYGNLCELVEKSTILGASQVASGNFTIGDKVECGREYFYVMTDHENAEEGTVSMLTTQNIEVTESNPKQSSSAGTLAFSDSGY